MAFPAIAVLVDARNEPLMAPDAVFPNDCRAVVGYPDSLGYPARIENIGIPHAGHAFEGEMPGHGVVRKVALDAFLLPVARVVEPVLILAFHYVAGGAEIGSSGSRVQSWRSEADEPPDRGKHDDK